MFSKLDLMQMIGSKYAISHFDLRKSIANVSDTVEYKEKWSYRFFHVCYVKFHFVKSTGGNIGQFILPGIELKTLKTVFSRGIHHKSNIVKDGGGK